MGRIRGNPRALLLLFFVLATFLTGTLYSIRDLPLAVGTSTTMAFAISALLVALAFVLLILGRIIWKAVPARAGKEAESSGVKGRDAN